MKITEQLIGKIGMGISQEITYKEDTPDGDMDTTLEFELDNKRYTVDITVCYQKRTIDRNTRDTPDVDVEISGEAIHCHVYMNDDQEGKDLNKAELKKIVIE